MSTFIERPFDASSDGKTLTNSNEQNLGRQLFDEIRQDFVKGGRTTGQGSENLQGILPALDICNGAAPAAGLDKLADQLSDGKLNNKSQPASRLEELFSDASSSGSATMDCVAEQLNQRLEPSGRVVKVVPEEGRMPVSSYTVSVFDLETNSRVLSVEAEGQGRK